MNYIIIDLEFNNMKNITKYCNAINKPIEDKTSKECPNEVIQIGAVKLDKSLKVIDSFDAYIKPVIFKTLNPAISELTGITEENLKEGISFIDAMELLGAFVDEDSILCSWAKDDITEIIRNSNYHQFYDVEWISEYLDLQEYCTKTLCHKETLGLKKALKRFNIKYEEGKLHNALNDAIYTAEVFRRLYNFKAIQNYIIKDIYTMPAILLTDYNSIDIEDNKLHIACPSCQGQIELEFPFELHKYKFISLGHCRLCGTKVKQELVVRKNLKGQKVYNHKDIILNEDQYSELCYKFRKIS